jgi:cytochrome P450
MPHIGGDSSRRGDEILVVASEHLTAGVVRDPLRFDPDRFLRPGAADLKRRVLPFGSGVRATARQFTQPAGLRARVVARRQTT